MLTKIFFVSLILLLSRAQSDQDYYFHAGALEASTIGGVTSFLSQLVNVPELTVSNLSNETISSLAEAYYGTDTFAPLLIRANNDYVWISASDIIPDNLTLRLPSVVYCTQFVGIDCILDSYRKSQGSTAASNYWNDLPISLQSQLSLYLSYPNYIYLAMSLLQDRSINPAPTLSVKLINLLNFDLINGAVSFTTGFGKAIASTIASNQEIVYNANRSDLLQGIHGSVSYDLAYRNSTRSFAIDFHAYASNGTFHNSLYFAGQDDYTTTSAGVRDLSLGSGVNALVSITSSPGAVMTVIFYQSTTNLNLTGVKRLVPYSKNTNAFGVRWDTTYGYYAYGSAPKTTYLWQGFRFMPVQSPPLQDNRFLIIHGLTNLALEVNPAFGNFTLGTPNKKNVNQIWSVIPSAASATSYYIKGSQGLCLYTNPSFLMDYSTSTSLVATWLEPCLRAAEEGNLSWTIEALNSYTFDP